MHSLVTKLERYENKSFDNLLVAQAQKRSNALIVPVYARSGLNTALMESIRNRTELVQALKKEMATHIAADIVAKNSHLIKEIQNSTFIGIEYDFKALIVSEEELAKLLLSAYALGQENKV
jgi:hypothetical protein